MNMSFMNNFPKPKYFTPKQTILSKGNSFSSTQIFRNINNNSIIQNKGKEEEDKIYNEIKKNIIDNYKDEKNLKFLLDYNEIKKKNVDDDLNKVFGRKEREENAKRKREEMEEQKNLKLRKELDKKNNLWEIKMMIDKNYNSYYQDQLRRANQYY